MIDQIIDEIRPSNTTESKDHGIRGNMTMICREMNRFYETVFNGYMEGSFKKIERRKCLKIAFLACELVRYQTDRSLEEIRKDIRAGVDQAIKKHPNPLRNVFEAYEVLDEEIDELKREIRKDDFDNAVAEAVHVAVVCVRMIHELHK